MTRLQITQLWFVTLAASIALANMIFGWIKRARQRMRTARLQRQLNALKATMLACGGAKTTLRTADPDIIKVLEFAYPTRLMWHRHIGPVVEYHFPLARDEFDPHHLPPP